LRFPKKIKKNPKKTNPRIRFFHLKMQHDDSKCPKFSSTVEIEYKRLTYKDTIVTAKKLQNRTLSNYTAFRIFLNFIFNFFPTARPSFSGGLSRKPTNNKHVALPRADGKH
jgi:hypothetical protein